MKIKFENMHIPLALKAKGLLLPIGSTAGSKEKWRQHFIDNPGSQRKAFDAVSYNCLTAVLGAWANGGGPVYIVAPFSQQVNPPKFVNPPHQ